MFDDSFKNRYTTIPFATFERKAEILKKTPSFLHNHKEIELLLITGGEVQVCVETEKYIAKEGDVIIVAPYVPHTVTGINSSKVSLLCLCFDLSLIPVKNLKNRLENGTDTVISTIKNSNDDAAHLAEFIKKAFDAHAAQKNGWELEVTGSLCLFFAMLEKSGYIKYGVSGGKEICRRIIEYIDKNYAFGITSADIAKELFISESYFCRIFKANFGQPFQKYLCMYRIEKSKTLLKTTDMPVSQIADATGFNSFSYFGKMFKEYVGKPPLEYRKTHIK